MFCLNKYIEFKNYYKRHPDKFVEEFLGVKLYPYQKLLLRSICIKDNIQSMFRPKYSLNEKLAMAISHAIDGGKVIIAEGKNSKITIADIEKFVCNYITNYENIIYKTEDNKIKFSTGGEIEIYKA